MLQNIKNTIKELLEQMQQGKMPVEEAAEGLQAANNKLEDYIDRRVGIVIAILRSPFCNLKLSDSPVLTAELAHCMASEIERLVYGEANKE